MKLTADNEQPTEGGMGVSAKPGGVLVIEKVRRRQDKGVYTCTASTRQGRAATSSLQVTVLGKASPSLILTYNTVHGGFY